MKLGRTIAGGREAVESDLVRQDEGTDNSS